MPKWFPRGSFGFFVAGWLFQFITMETQRQTPENLFNLLASIIKPVTDKKPIIKTTKTNDMKKLITLSLALLVVSMSYGQINGIDFSKALDSNKCSDCYEKLVTTPSGWAIIYKETPVGVKHCWDKMIEIMNANDLVTGNAIKEDVLLASYVDGYYDYENLSLSLMTGDSEITFSWVKDGYLVVLIMTQGAIAIMFGKL